MYSIRRGILSLDHLEDVVDDGRDGTVRAVIVGFAPAVEPLVGFDFDQDAGAAAKAGHVALDRCDFHGRLPVEFNIVVVSPLGETGPIRVEKYGGVQAGSTRTRSVLWREKMDFTIFRRQR